MNTVTIYDMSAQEYVCKDMEAWGMADALVNAFCDSDTPREVYDACIACADAYAKGEPTCEWESFLNIWIY